MISESGLPTELFLGILSTASGSARSLSRRAIQYQSSRRQAATLSIKCCSVHLSGQAPTHAQMPLPFPIIRCKMKNPTFVAELHQKLGAPSSEIVESLRLLKTFVKLAPRQRFEVIELVERLATDALASPDHPLS